MHLRKRQESDGKISLSPPKSLILGINRVSSFWSFCESRFFLFLSFCCENLSSWLSTLMSKLECLTDFDTYTRFCRYTISWMWRKDIYQLIPSSPQLCFWIPPSSCMSQGLSQDGLLVDNDRDPSNTTSCYVLSFDVLQWKVPEQEWRTCAPETCFTFTASSRNDFVPRDSSTFSMIHPSNEFQAGFEKEKWVRAFSSLTRIRQVCNQKSKRVHLWSNPGDFCKFQQSSKTQYKPQEFLHE